MSIENSGESQTINAVLAKVPAVTLVFWIIKIICTTLGETAGDAVTMSLNLGYLIGTAIFAAIFVVAVFIQMRAKAFHPLLYWITIIATTTVGTTMADYTDRSLGIGYAGGSLLLFGLLMGSLLLWRLVMGSIDVNKVNDVKSEAFYWITIMFSQTLGTALGDWMADKAGMGYLGSTAVFGAALAVIAALYFFSKVSKTLLFWGAFILTRPLGAVVGDYLDKPVKLGGLSIDRFEASGLLLVVALLLIILIPQKAGKHE